MMCFLLTTLGLICTLIIIIHYYDNISYYIYIHHVLNNWNEFFLIYFNCIVQDSLHYDIHIGTMWHCVSVSGTTSWSIGLHFGLALFWCWVSLCVRFTNSLTECYFFIMVATNTSGIFISILLILIHTFGIYVSRWFWFCKYAPFWMFPSLDSLLEYWIEHVTFGLLYVLFRFSSRDISQGSPRLTI